MIELKVARRCSGARYSITLMEGSCWEGVGEDELRELDFHRDPRSSTSAASWRSPSRRRWSWKQWTTSCSPRPRDVHTSGDDRARRNGCAWRRSTRSSTARSVSSPREFRESAGTGTAREPGRSSRLVVLDAAGTLVDVAGSVGEAYAEDARAAGADLDPVEIERCFGRAMRAAPPLAFGHLPSKARRSAARGWWRAVAGAAMSSAGELPAGFMFESFFDRAWERFSRPMHGACTPTFDRPCDMLRARGFRWPCSRIRRALKPLLTELGAPAANSRRRDRFRRSPRRQAQPPCVRGSRPRARERRVRQGSTGHGRRPTRSRRAAGAGGGMGRRLARSRGRQWSAGKRAGRPRPARAVEPVGLTEPSARPRMATMSEFFAGQLPRKFAHRGASGTHPENTMDAFRAAVELGAEAFELDVHRSADGHVVVFHDDALGRTTNGAGLIHERSLVELKELDAGCRFSPTAVAAPVSRPVSDPHPRGGLEAFPRTPLIIETSRCPRLGRDLHDCCGKWGPRSAFCSHRAVSAHAVPRYRAGAADRLRATGRVGLPAVSDPTPGTITARRRWRSRCHDVARNPSRESPVRRRGTASAARCTFGGQRSGARWQALLELGVDGLITDFPQRLSKLLSGGRSG